MSQAGVGRIWTETGLSYYMKCRTILLIQIQQLQKCYMVSVTQSPII